jgi:hypothetical protein
MIARALRQLINKLSHAEGRRHADRTRTALLKDAGRMARDGMPVAEIEAALCAHVRAREHGER